MTELPQVFHATADSFDPAPPDFAPCLAVANRVSDLSMRALVEALMREGRESATRIPNDAVLVVNRSGMVLCESTSLLELLSFAPGALIGGRFFEFVFEADLPTVYAAFLNVVEGLERVAAVRFRHRAGNGEFLPVRAMVMRLDDDAAPLVVFRMEAARKAGSRL